MNNLRRQFEQFRDEIEAARAAQANRDRPTSLYSAGTVGNREPLVPARPPSAASDERARTGRPVDDGSPRRRTGDVASSEAVVRRDREFTDTEGSRRRTQQRPEAVTQPRIGRNAHLRARLTSPQGLRTAILLHEVLGPPVSLRKNDDQF